MIIIAFGLLLIGILCTGTTREEIFEQSSTQRKGLILCTIGIIFSYFLSILWIFFIVIITIICFIYLIFSQICLPKSYYSNKDCLDFKMLKSLKNDIPDSVCFFF